MIRRQKIYTLEKRDSTIGLWHFRGNLNGEYPGTDLTPRLPNLTYESGRTEDGITGLFGGGGSLDGGYLPAADATAFDFGTDNVTIEIVANIYDPYTDWPLRKITSTPVYNGFIMGISYDATGYSFLVGLGDGVTFELFVSDTKFPKHSQAWHHWAIVLDRDNDLMRLYMDGVEDGNSPFDISGLGSISSPTADLEFNPQCRGVLDEVCISEEVLTAAAIAERAAGKWNDMRVDEDGFMISQLPAVLQGNDDLTAFLKPFDLTWGDMRQLTQDLSRISRWDECPDYLLEDLTALYGFELISERYADVGIRRAFVQLLPWIYRRKGTLAVAHKFLDLLEFTYTAEESFPPWVPLVSNFHRTFNRSQSAVIDFLDDFSSHNLSQWNRQLSFDAWWRISTDPDGTGHLRGTGDGTVAATNGIVFDEMNQDYHMAVDFDILDGFGPDTEFGVYVRYYDVNNYIRVHLAVDGSGNATVQLARMMAGAGHSTTPVNIDDLDIDVGRHTIIIHYNVATERYVIAIDNTTIIYQEHFESAGIADDKKGLWVGRDLTVEFSDVTVDHLDTNLMSMIYSTVFARRYLTIDLTNSPDHLAERVGYIVEVLPRYIPLGVSIAWPMTVAEIVGEGVIEEPTMEFAVPGGEAVGEGVIEEPEVVLGDVDIEPAEIVGEGTVEEPSVGFYTGGIP
jgi:hypothetical protein